MLAIQHTNKGDAWRADNKQRCVIQVLLWSVMKKKNEGTVDCVTSVIKYSQAKRERSNRCAAVQKCVI